MDILQTHRHCCKLVLHSLKSSQCTTVHVTRFHNTFGSCCLGHAVVRTLKRCKGLEFYEQCHSWKRPIENSFKPQHGKFLIVPFKWKVGQPALSVLVPAAHISLSGSGSMRTGARLSFHNSNNAQSMSNFATTPVRQQELNDVSTNRNLERSCRKGEGV